MDVKMHTIKAGPDGCADAGTTITVSDVEGKRLVDGKFAVAATRPNRETAMFDPARQEQAERDKAKASADEASAKEASSKTAQVVGKALDALDPMEDDDWTANGKPAMDRVKELTGSTTLTRAELKALYPDFSRPAVPEGGESAEIEAAGSEPVPHAASGARSNGL